MVALCWLGSTSTVVRASRTGPRLPAASGSSGHVVPATLPLASAGLGCGRRALLLAGVCTVARRKPRRSSRRAPRSAVGGASEQRAARDGASDSYVRVVCATARRVGSSGAIVAVRQFRDMDAPCHQLDLPVEFPLLLHAGQAEELAAALRGGPSFARHLSVPLESLALYEVRAHACGDEGLRGELVLAESCSVPKACRDDGLFDALDGVTKERTVQVTIGDAIAMAMRFSLPVFLDARATLRAGLHCIDRMRLEQVLCMSDDEECDLELLWLRERLAVGVTESASTCTIGRLMEELKPFAWYWVDRVERDGGGQLVQNMEAYQARYRQINDRQKGMSV